MKLKAAMEFAAYCSLRCSEVKASPDEALTNSIKDTAPAKIDLQADLLITHDIDININIIYYL